MSVMYIYRRHPSKKLKTNAQRLLRRNTRNTEKITENTETQNPHSSDHSNNPGGGAIQKH